MIKVRGFICSTSNLMKCHNSNFKKISSMPPDFKEENIKISTGYVNYLKVGHGAHNVLCFPGALGSIWTDFKPQIEGLDKDNFTVVAWDPPGYGKSRPPNKEFPIDFYEKDAHSAAELMKTLNIQKYSLLGWSDGGVSSLILAARYPTNVKKLVVWGSNAFILPEEIESYEKIKDVRKWSEKMRKPMVELYGEEYFPVLWDQWIEGVKNIFKAKNGDICTAELEKIKCPTFIIHGQKDPMVDNCHVSHLHTNISNSRIHLYPDGKHNVHLRYADDFNKRVQEFLLA